MSSPRPLVNYVDSSNRRAASGVPAERRERGGLEAPKRPKRRPAKPAYASRQRAKRASTSYFPPMSFRRESRFRASCTCGCSAASAFFQSSMKAR